MPRTTEGSQSVPRDGPCVGTVMRQSKEEPALGGDLAGQGHTRKPPSSRLASSLSPGGKTETHGDPGNGAARDFEEPMCPNIISKVRGQKEFEKGLKEGQRCSLDGRGPEGAYDPHSHPKKIVQTGKISDPKRPRSKRGRGETGPAGYERRKHRREQVTGKRDCWSTRNPAVNQAAPRGSR